MSSAGTAARYYMFRPPDRTLARTRGFLWTLRIVACGWLCIGMLLGGPFLWLACVLAALLLPLADRAGALRCLFAATGLAVGLWLADLCGVPLGLGAVRYLGLPLWVALPGTLLLLAAVGVVGVTRLGRLVTRTTRRHRYIYVLNRSAGLVLGVGMGFLAATVLTWLAAMFGPAIHHYCQAVAGESERHYPLLRVFRPLDRAQAWLRRDPASAALAGRNPLERVGLVVRSVTVAEFAAGQHMYWKALAQGEFREFLSIPVVRRHYEAFESDPDIRRAVDERDLDSILNSPPFAAALGDDELCAVVAEHWPRLRDKISARQVREAQAVAEELGPAARENLEQAVRKAEDEYDVDVPGL